MRSSAASNRSDASEDLDEAVSRAVPTEALQRRFDEFDGVFADFRPVLDVGKLQHTEFAGLVELQSPQSRGYGKRAIVAFFRRLDARSRGRGFCCVLQFSHIS